MDTIISRWRGPIAWAVTCVALLALSQVHGDAQTAAQLILSAVLLGASVYVILSGKYTADTQKWAFGIVGTLLGYWLKQSR